MQVFLKEDYFQNILRRTKIIIKINSTNEDNIINNNIYEYCYFEYKFSNETQKIKVYNIFSTNYSFIAKAN